MRVYFSWFCHSLTLVLSLSNTLLLLKEFTDNNCLSLNQCNPFFNAYLHRLLKVYYTDGFGTASKASRDRWRIEIPWHMLHIIFQVCGNPANVSVNNTLFSLINTPLFFLSVMIFHNPKVSFWDCIWYKNGMAITHALLILCYVMLLDK